MESSSNARIFLFSVGIFCCIILASATASELRSDARKLTREIFKPEGVVMQRERRSDKEETPESRAVTAPANGTDEEEDEDEDYYTDDDNDLRWLVSDSSSSSSSGSDEGHHSVVHHTHKKHVGVKKVRGRFPLGPRLVKKWLDRQFLRLFCWTRNSLFKFSAWKFVRFFLRGIMPMASCVIPKHFDLDILKKFCMLLGESHHGDHHHH